MLSNLNFPHNLGKEIIVVDDGSDDGTSELLRQFTESENIEIIRNGVNRGKAAALKLGLAVASGKIVAIQDADMEYDPRDLPRLVENLLDRRVSAVYGSRFLNKLPSSRLSRIIGNLFLSLATRVLFRIEVTDVMTGHKVFLRELLNHISLTSNDFEFEVELTAKIALLRCKIFEIPIRYQRRRNGSSHISWLDGVKSLWRLVMCRVSMIL